MSEHEQQQDEGADEQEETLGDLDVPQEEGEDVVGGVKVGEKFHE